VVGKHEGKTVSSTNQTETGGSRLLIVDDRALLRDSLSRALAASRYVVFTNPADDAAVVITQARELSPDTILLGSHLENIDPEMPITTTLSELGANVIVLTRGKDPLTQAGFAQQGACGFVDIRDPFRALEEALQCISRGTAAVDPVTTQKLARLWREHRQAESARLESFQRLSKRETAILRDIYDGLGAAQIADESFVSINTVRSQIRSILEKLDVGSQVGAVAVARKSRWFDDRAL
jgi:DNA-binding NarL/FixJ family response regulator